MMAKMSVIENTDFFFFPHSTQHGAVKKIDVHHVGDIEIPK